MGRFWLISITWGELDFRSYWYNIISKTMGLISVRKYRCSIHLPISWNISIFIYPTRKSAHPEVLYMPYLL